MEIVKQPSIANFVPQARAGWANDFPFYKTHLSWNIMSIRIVTNSISIMSMLKFAVVAAAVAGGAVEARKASRGSLRASKTVSLRSSSGTCSGTTYDFFML